MDIRILLLEHGTDVNYTTGTGYTALMWAAQNRHTDIVNVLVRYGAIIPPITSAQARNISIQALKKSKVSPLALAIIIRDKEGAMRLLDKNGTVIFDKLMSYFLPNRTNSVNYRDNFGMTALHWAVAQNYNELVEDLVNGYNSNLTIQDNEGNTALHLAARNGNDLIVFKCYLLIILRLHLYITTRDIFLWDLPDAWVIRILLIDLIRM